MLQAFKPRVDLRIRMLGQRPQEQLDCSLCDRQIVVECMRGEGDRTRVKRGESPQLGQGLLQVISCLDNRSSNLSLHVYHYTPPIHWSMGELLSSGGQTYYFTARRRLARLGTAHYRPRPSRAHDQCPSTEPGGHMATQST